MSIYFILIFSTPLLDDIVLGWTNIAAGAYSSKLFLSSKNISIYSRLLNVVKNYII